VSRRLVQRTRHPSLTFGGCATYSCSFIIDWTLHASGSLPSVPRFSGHARTGWAGIHAQSGLQLRPGGLGSAKKTRIRRDCRVLRGRRSLGHARPTRQGGPHHSHADGAAWVGWLQGAHPVKSLFIAHRSRFSGADDPGRSRPTTPVLSQHQGALGRVPRCDATALSTAWDNRPWRARLFRRDSVPISRRYAHLNGLGCFTCSDPAGFRRRTRNPPVLMFSRGKPLLTDGVASFKRD
jgi:hypothetical protein